MSRRTAAVLALCAVLLGMGPTARAVGVGVGESSMTWDWACASWATDDRSESIRVCGDAGASGSSATVVHEDGTVSNERTTTEGGRWVSVSRSRCAEPGDDDSPPRGCLTTHLS